MDRVNELREMITDGEIEIERLYMDYEEAKKEPFCLHGTHYDIDVAMTLLRGDINEFRKEIFEIENTSDGTWNQQQKNLYDFSMNGSNTYFKECNCGY